MAIEYILFFVGLILLVKGSDFFVRSASSIAKRLGVSEFMIGLTLVAVGTSIPELASAVAASIKGQGAVVLGNVLGADIANIGFITGIAAVLAVIKTKKEMLEMDGYLMLSAVILFFVFILDLRITRIESAFLLLMYVAYIFFLFSEQSKFKGKYHFKEFVKYFVLFKYLGALKNGVAPRLANKKEKNSAKSRNRFFRGVLKDFAVMALSGAAIAFGAAYFITGAVSFANLLKIPGTIIGLTLVSLGTTLPELSVTVSAARKGYGNIALGNIIGSNIANIFLVLGVAGMISPIPVIKSVLFFTAPFLILMSILLLAFIKSHWEIRRIEGIVFLILYVVFIAVLLLKFV